jgi:hypothetical protein
VETWYNRFFYLLIFFVRTFCFSSNRKKDRSEEARRKLNAIQDFLRRDTVQRMNLESHDYFSPTFADIEHDASFENERKMLPLSFHSQFESETEMGDTIDDSILRLSFPQIQMVRVSVSAELVDRGDTGIFSAV